MGKDVICKTYTKKKVRIAPRMRCRCLYYNSTQLNQIPIEAFTKSSAENKTSASIGVE